MKIILLTLLVCSEVWSIKHRNRKVREDPPKDAPKDAPADAKGAEAAPDVAGALGPDAALSGRQSKPIPV